MSLIRSCVGEPLKRSVTRHQNRGRAPEGHSPDSICLMVVGYYSVNLQARPCCLCEPDQDGGDGGPLRKVHSDGGLNNSDESEGSRAYGVSGGGDRARPDPAPPTAVHPTPLQADAGERCARPR